MARNLATLLTPPGPAAIAVVRLGGPMIQPFLMQHFTGCARPGRCVHGKLIDGDRTIDDPVVVLSDDSLTADINLHGGEWVVQECLELARRFGFELVEQCDDLLDGADEIEREMLAALPLALTEPAVRILLAQPRQWRDLLKPDLQARVKSLKNPDLKVRLDWIKRVLDDRSLWWMLHPPKIAIVGMPNVGKSTLANQLFGQQRSITADIPGTTRDWVADIANLDGLPIHLLDTPGLRDSPDAIEQAAITRSAREIAGADLTLLVLDPTQALEPHQSDLRRRFPGAMTIVNKTDLPALWDVSTIPAIHTVATDGLGLDDLRSQIRADFDCDDMTTEHPRCWTERQRALLERIAESEQP